MSVLGVVMKQLIRRILFLLAVTGLFFLSLFIKSPEKNPAAPTAVNAAYDDAPLKKISVSNEWGTLSAAVLGSADMLTHVVCEALEDGEACSLKRLSETDDLMFDQLKAELKNLEDVMTQNGVTVFQHTPENISTDELFYRHDATFGVNFLCARSPLLIAGNKLIETAPTFPEALSAKFSIRKVLRFFLQTDLDTYLLSMPEPSPDFAADSPYLNTANTLVDGKTVYVGVPADSPYNAGVAWLRRALNGVFDVREIALKDGDRQLDDVLAFISSDTLLYEKDAFAKELPAPLRRRKQIAVAPEDNVYGLGDMVVLSPKKIVLNEKNVKLKEILEKLGVQVVPLPFDVIGAAQIDLRCLYLPLMRAAK